MNRKRNQLSPHALQTMESRVLLAAPTPAEQRAAARQDYVDDLYAQYLENPNATVGRFGVTVAGLLDSNIRGGLVPTGFTGTSLATLTPIASSDSSSSQPATSTTTSNGPRYTVSQRGSVTVYRLDNWQSLFGFK